MNKTGLVHIYTGTGKGKTTAAIGLCTRALGHGLKVCYVSFHKQPEKYGYNEMDSLRKLGAQVINHAKGHPHLDKTLDSQKIKEETYAGLNNIKEIIEKESFDLLVLDEIIISVRDGFLDEQELVEFIKNKPPELELVLTGRGARANIIELADYVSEINHIKHPYDSGISSREGIEF
jgi:cob(I)alamin adenosyltransferase